MFFKPESSQNTIFLTSPRPARKMPTLMVQPAMSFVPAGSPNSQRVAVLEEVGKLVVKHAAIPLPSPDEVRVRIQYVGICGSDVEAFRGLRSPE